MANPTPMQFEQMGVLPTKFFSTPEWGLFRSEIAGIQEFVAWDLYSFKAYATAGHTSLQFFDQNEGGATNQEADTNMTGSGGQLPANQMMVVAAVRVVPIPSSTDLKGSGTTSPVALSQWYNVLTNNCYLEIKVSEKVYTRGAPLTMFPSGFGYDFIVGNGGTTEIFALPRNGEPNNRSLFHVDPPYGILPGRPIKAKAVWNAAQTVGTAGRLGVILSGWLIRAVQ